MLTAVSIHGNDVRLDQHVFYELHLVYVYPYVVLVNYQFLPQK